MTGFWIGIVVIALLVWIFFCEPNWYRLRRIRLDGRKKLKHPFTILHLSDIHFQGKEGGPKKRFFQRLSMLNPDLIFITGDTLDANSGIETAVRMFGGLRARYGTFLILGNHEYYEYHLKDIIRYYAGLGKTAAYRIDVPRFTSEMKKIGIRVLVNESAKLEVHGNPIFIGGTDDPVTQRVDFERTLNGMSPATFNILLTHHIDSLLKLSHHGIDIALAGHTHGGQIRIPFWGPILKETKLPRRYGDGLNEYSGITTFVSRGMGTGKYLTLRFACRPEAILFEIAP